MPEIKNTFLAGKMNKDRDLRLVPEGEYLEALNIQITKSEANDVGVIQNIVGNQLAHTSLGLASGYEVIGSFFDERNNRIFWFVTNDTNNYIYLWNVGGANATAIVSGIFLNFNKNNKITGVNLLEDLLFWTDNRNQPRRINVVTAIGNNSYYNSEAKISVARIAPWKAPTIINTYHDTSIQSRLMEEEFVRFAYRYKFSNNEYSIISPFSQIVFELGNESTSTNVISQSDENRIFQSSENFKFINRINKVDLGIHVFSQNPISDYEIVSVEILYKESDSTAVRVVDTVKLTDGLSSDTYTYTYRSTPPKSTLPEDQITRAFDNVPIKALAQEVAGNRVIYGNFTQNYEVPTLFYSVYSSIKNDSKYPHHSVKQRRDYEVGIVLADKYGRTSPVILSNSSRVTSVAKNENFDSLSWPGDSLKIIFTANAVGGDLYNPNSATDDLGWYSYRVVVKQVEQEYYNVYNPGITRGYLTIYNDNINKVPRNTSDSIDSDDLYPTDVRLYPKLINYSSGSIAQAILQKNSNEGLYNIESIGTADAFDLYDADTVDKSLGFYEQRKFHLLGKLEEGIIGNNQNTPFNGVLSVFETEPFRSTLDIYYETSTSGLIHELNASQNINISNVLVEPEGYGSGVEGALTVKESTPIGSYIARLRGIDQSSGLDVDGTTFALTSSTGQFAIEKDPLDGYYKIKTLVSFVAGLSGPYNLNITPSFGGSSFQQDTSTVTITHSTPTITQMGSISIAKDFYSVSTAPHTVFTLSVTNGSSTTGINRYFGISSSDITYQEYHDGVLQTSAFIFGYTYSNGQVFLNAVSGTTTHSGKYITVKLTLTNGGLTTTSEGIIYISNTTGGGSGLTAINMKYDLNASEYLYANTPSGGDSTRAACPNLSLFPYQGDLYVDAGVAITSGPQLYGTSDGKKLASSGWYIESNGNTAGKWLKVQSGTDADGKITYIGYWDILPTTCTT